MKTPCPKCGSSDARHLYENHSYCFSCRTPFPGDKSPYLFQSSNKSSERAFVTLALPDDCNTSYPSHVLAWTGKYGITIEELIKHHVYYSKARDQLVFSWYSPEGSLLCWQARNFSPSAKSKCFTQGPVAEVLPIYQRLQETNGNVLVARQACLVIVEDPISAIKISRWCSAMPCLGSDLPRDKIKRLADVLESFLGVSEVVVWLDSDMFHNAQRLVQRFQALGVDARAVWTEKDPKEYSDEEITKLLSGNK